MTTNQGYAADGRTPLHSVPGRELLVSAVAFNGAVGEIARLQAQVAELAGALQELYSAGIDVPSETYSRFGKALTRARAALAALAAAPPEAHARADRQARGEAAPPVRTMGVRFGVEPVLVARAVPQAAGGCVMGVYEQKARVTDNTAAMRIAAEADAEIARLQAQVAELQAEAKLLRDELEQYKNHAARLAGALNR